MPAIPFPKKKVARETALEELAILERTYPHAVTALEYANEFQLLIAVILSAQCTDARVNATTPALFAKYPTPAKLAAAKQADVEQIIKSCGFFRMKARNVINCARDLVERFGGSVPRDRESLESLAGVGRKTASVVMAAAFQEAALAVDTHVFRVAHRLGLTLGKTPRQVEDDLTALQPPRKWGDTTHWLIMHGRAVCKAPTPRCAQCPVAKLCPTPAIISRTLTARARSNGSAAPAARRRRAPSARKKA
ncbi:MAG: endonuclease III [Candidatus Eremiobacteraeota bacterium]|nr:endonuclease III [Candidatus Eremiobacteraeota bacterium]